MHDYSWRNKATWFLEVKYCQKVVPRSNQTGQAQDWPLGHRGGGLALQPGADPPPSLQLSFPVNCKFLLRWVSGSQFMSPHIQLVQFHSCQNCHPCTLPLLSWDRFFQHSGNCKSCNLHFLTANCTFELQIKLWPFLYLQMSCSWQILVICTCKKCKLQFKSAEGPGPPQNCKLSPDVNKHGSNPWDLGRRHWGKWRKCASKR